MRSKRSKASFHRKLNTLEERKRFLIVCEGTKTEPNYFKAFPTNTEVVSVEVEGTGYNTVSLVDRALRSSGNGGYDEVWCVFDKDSFSPELVNRAIELANSNDIKVAFSNEAFELWYLMHFHYYDSAITRQDYIDKLTNLLGTPYRKNSPDMYDILEGRMEDAIRRSQRLLESYRPRRPAYDNPSTTVHLLVEKLRRFGRQSVSCNLPGV